MGFIGKAAAVIVLVLAVVIAGLPRLLYTDLPSDLSLDLTKPTTIVVTGANSGLGLATVQHFAHNELATIIMACRSMSRCNAAKQSIYDNLGSDVVKANLQPMPLDLSQKSSIERFAKELQNQPIHILINNAGLAGTTPELSYHPEDGVENHIRINHLGHVYLTHCLWKNLQAAKQARIVAVSSLLGAPSTNVPTKGWYKGEETIRHMWNIKLYGRSKRANLFFAHELQSRFGDKKGIISATAAHPGFTHSGLCKNGCQGQNKVGKFLSNLELLTGTIKMTAEDGALPQAYAAVVPQGGVYLGPSLALVGKPVILGTLSNSWHHMPFTRDESKYLWDKSLEAMDIKVFGEFEIAAEDEKEEPQSPKEDHDEPVMTSEESAAEAGPEKSETQEVPMKEEETARPPLAETDKEDKATSDDDDDDDELNEIMGTYLGDGKYREAVIM